MGWSHFICSQEAGSGQKVGSDNKTARPTLVAFPPLKLYLLKCPGSKNKSANWVPKVSETVGDSSHSKHKGNIMKPAQDRKERRKRGGKEKR